MTRALVHRFQTARRDPAVAVLEGLHALKHALRFGAHVLDIAADESAPIDELAGVLAPELVDRIAGRVTRVTRPTFETLAPYAPSTGLLAIARRPRYGPAAPLGAPGPAPVVLLEQPRGLGNVGAVVRVAAAADAAGVLCIGELDPWQPAALRGSAGLHFALPVARADALPASNRPLIAVDPAGDPLPGAELPARAILAFGSERYGLSPDLLGSADRLVGIPMRAGISSLNLATAVAVVLYTGYEPPGK